MKKKDYESRIIALEETIKHINRVKDGFREHYNRLDKKQKELIKFVRDVKNPVTMKTPETFDELWDNKIVFPESCKKYKTFLHKHKTIYFERDKYCKSEKIRLTRDDFEKYKNEFTIVFPLEKPFYDLEGERRWLRCE